MSAARPVESERVQKVVLATPSDWLSNARQTRQTAIAEPKIASRSLRGPDPEISELQAVRQFPISIYQ